MKMKNRVVLIIPYFGRIPDYFELWLRSAEANPDFTFFLYTDLPFPVREDSNVKIKHITFAQIKQLIRQKCGADSIVGDPYKLCDYKPAFGELFAEDIEGFDFWGFCDVDVILGNLKHYLPDEHLDRHDKLYSHGHFCLMRNNGKMNSLYRKVYPGVVDFEYTRRTNYVCHFDENGTIAYAPEYDGEIRFYNRWSFYDVPANEYRMMLGENETYAVWKDGTLMLYQVGAEKPREIMYIHLQKRKMHGMERVDGEGILVFRNEFYSPEDRDCVNNPVDTLRESAFLESRKASRRKEIFSNIKKGALKFRIYKSVYRWRQR